MSIDRLSLLEWLLPYCEPNTVCIMYPKGKSDRPGWVNGQELSDRAIGAYRAGSLASESFDSITQDGKPYRITHGSRLTLVPHRDGGVVRVCFDFDDHEGDGASEGQPGVGIASGLRGGKSVYRASHVRNRD